MIFGESENVSSGHKRDKKSTNLGDRFREKYCKATGVCLSSQRVNLLRGTLRNLLIDALFPRRVISMTCPICNPPTLLKIVIKATVQVARINGYGYAGKLVCNSGSEILAWLVPLKRSFKIGCLMTTKCPLRGTSQLVDPVTFLFSSLECPLCLI